MEAIAAASGVSIMTLYRHARTKDDLFEAVVSQACEPSAETDDAQMIETIMQKPLIEILKFIATRFRNRLRLPETLGLLRAAMAEHVHFPHLGPMIFEGFVASHIRQMTQFLATRPEAKSVSKNRVAELGEAFFNQLLGTDHLRALLGLPSEYGEDGHTLIQHAAETLVEGLRCAKEQGSLR